MINFSTLYLYPKPPPSYIGKTSPDDATHAIWNILGLSYKLQTAVTQTDLTLGLREGSHSELQSKCLNYIVLVKLKHKSCY